MHQGIWYNFKKKAIWTGQICQQKQFWKDWYIEHSIIFHNYMIMYFMEKNCFQSSLIPSASKPSTMKTHFPSVNKKWVFRENLFPKKHSIVAWNFKSGLRNSSRQIPLKFTVICHLILTHPICNCRNGSSSMASRAVRSRMPAAKPPTFPLSTLWMIAPPCTIFLKTVSHDQLRSNGKGDFLRTIRNKNIWVNCLA